LPFGFLINFASSKVSKNKFESFCYENELNPELIIKVFISMIMLALLAYTFDTLARTELLCMKNAGTQWAIEISSNE
jgi:hypothetical protein